MSRSCVITYIRYKIRKVLRIWLFFFLGSILQSNPNQQALLKAMDESANKVNLMPEYLVVCCWRSIKEVSLLLGQLTESTPIIHEIYDATVLKSSNEDGLLSVEQVKMKTKL